MDVSLTAWAALIGGLIALLLLDLFVIHRDATVVSIRDAAWSTAGFIAVSVAFGIALGVVEGVDVAQQFFAGYVLEKSLSLDNVFVWAMIFSSFGVPEAYQRRVLFYGVFSALVLRAAFVAPATSCCRASSGWSTCSAHCCCGAACACCATVRATIPRRARS